MIIIVLNLLIDYAIETMIYLCCGFTVRVFHMYKIRDFVVVTVSLTLFKISLVIFFVYYEAPTKTQTHWTHTCQCLTHL